MLQLCVGCFEVKYIKWFISCGESSSFSPVENCLLCFPDLVININLNSSFQLIIYTCWKYLVHNFSKVDINISFYVCFAGWFHSSSHGCKSHREHLHHCLWPLPSPGYHRDRLRPVVPVHSLHSGGCQSHCHLSQFTCMKTDTDTYAHTNIFVGPTNRQPKH